MFLRVTMEGKLYLQHKKNQVQGEKGQWWGKGDFCNTFHNKLMSRTL